MDERQLIDLLKKDSRSALDAVWKIIAPKLYKYLCARTRPRRYRDPQSGAWLYDYSDADEILAQTFLEFFRDAASFRGECKVQSFIMNLAHHNLTDYYRKYDLDHPSGIGAALSVIGDGNGDGNDDASAWETGDDGIPARDFVDGNDYTAQVETGIEIRARLEALSPLHRDVILRQLFFGETAKQTGEALEITPQAVRSCLYRALGVLKANYAMENVREDGDSI